MIDETIHPAASWLINYGKNHDSDLSQDDNGDGINLLTAYALDLNPHKHLAGNMPRPIVSDLDLQINFYATSAGITYRVETSQDLKTWTTQGITLSEITPDNRRNATVPLNATHTFLRLVFTEN